MFARKLVLIAALCLAAVSAHAQTMVFTTFMSGPQENPPNNSPGTGTATLTIDLTAHTFQLVVNFQGLLGTVTNAHIHGPVQPPGNAAIMTQTPTLTGFPSGVTTGSYNRTFDMTQASTWNPTFMNNNGGTPAGAESAFVNAVTSGGAYLNIHSSMFGGGEIRGFFAPIPEPGTTSLLAMAGAGAALVAWRRRRKI
jgi:hypothetical protein